jgi:hypothetical protein
MQALRSRTTQQQVTRLQKRVAGENRCCVLYERGAWIKRYAGGAQAGDTTKITVRRKQMKTQTAGKTDV